MAIHFTYNQNGQPHGGNRVKVREPPKSLVITDMGP